jgi:predicted TIM-barrel fold metal-dependent hydrolase
MIVDVHHHYALESQYPEYTDLPADLVAAMDRRGWQWTCLNGLGPRFHNHDNAAVLKAVARFPDRLVGLGYLDPDRDPPEQVDKLADQGMRGLKVIGTLRRYDDESYLPFYARAAARGLPILFHTGFLGGEPTAGPEDVSSDRYRPITLDRIARLFPSLALIAAHLGTMTWFHEALAVMQHPNVYGDTSGGVCDIEPEFYRLPLNNRIRWEKLLFGTDSLPNDGHIPFEHTTRLLGELGVDAATRRLVLGETAARLFRLAPTGGT